VIFPRESAFDEGLQYSPAAKSCRLSRTDVDDEVAGMERRSSSP